MHSESFVKVGQKSLLPPAVYEYGARLISLMHHPYLSCPQTFPNILVKSHSVYQCTRPSFFPDAARVEHKTMFFLVAWQPCMQLFNQLNKKTVPILLHMIPNLLSLLISLAITCSIHTPHVFPSLLHSERREVSITMATISSQLHFKCM